MVEKINSQESKGSIDSTTKELEPQVAMSQRLQKDTSQQEILTKTQSLEEWADSIVAPDGVDIDGIQATVNLSRFGLKTPQDVIRFLRSPAGEATIAEIGAEIAKAEAIQAQQQFEQQQHSLLMHRLRALLLLWFIAKETNAAEKISELTKELDDKLLKAGDKSKSVKSSNQSDIAEAHSYFDKAINALTEKQNENTMLTKNLTERLEQLMEQEKSIVSKYSEYDSGLKRLEDSANNGNFTQEEIELKIKALSEEIDTMTSEIGNLLEEGKDTEARALLNKQNALNLQIGVLHDVRAVNNAQKYYADAEGNLVYTFKEAHFILVKGETPNLNQRIIKDNGQLYLLKPGQDWNTVKENPEAKAKARQEYKILKQDLMSVKSIVRHHKNYEHRIQNEQISDTKGRLDKAKQESLLLSNQLNLVQAARASSEDAAKQLHLSLRPIPSPTPTAGSSHTKKPSQASDTTFYREQIKALRDSHHITRGQLIQLASQAPAGKGKAAVEYIRKEFESYSRRGPIPQVLMQSYLRNLERFGVDTTKPGVTSIKSPIEEQKDTAPNPFKTKPHPFK